MHCEALKDIREKHKEAIKVFEQHPNWVYLPAPLKHENEEILRCLAFSRQLPQPEPLPKPRHHIFFIHGTEDSVGTLSARRTSWAVVHCNVVPEMPHESPTFRCLTTSMTKGHQTYNRAELQALLHALRVNNMTQPQRPARFYTLRPTLCTLLKDVHSGKFKSASHKSIEMQICFSTY